MENKKPKILLCEDDTNLGMVLKNYLELNDYDVVLERDGRLGLAAFQREKFDFNPRLRKLSFDGKNVQTLSPKENELLKMLSEYRNDLLPRDVALKKIWGSDTYFNGRSMDVYIAKLRKYLKEDPTIEIVNIHGNGFRLVVPS